MRPLSHIIRDNEQRTNQKLAELVKQADVTDKIVELSEKLKQEEAAA